MKWVGLKGEYINKGGVNTILYQQYIWNPPWIYIPYPLSDMQICHQLGKMELSFYQLASIWITICQLVYPTSWQFHTSL